MVPGTLVEVELKIVSKNDYEYLLIEEHKAAGLEPVDTQSGSVWNSGYYAYRELRDKQLSFYIDHLPRGEHMLSYQLRAESPGKFTRRCRPLSAACMLRNWSATPATRISPWRNEKTGQKVGDRKELRGAVT